MPRLDRSAIDAAVRGSAITPESKVVTLSDGTDVPFTVIPWAHHKAMEDMAIRQQVAAQMNGTPLELDMRTLGLPGVIFRSVLDHDGSRIFASEDEVEAWLESLGMDDLSLVEQAAQWVRTVTALAGDGTVPSLAEVGKASSRTMPS